MNTRRNFLRNVTTASLASQFVGGSWAWGNPLAATTAPTTGANDQQKWLLKTLKIGMVRVPGNLVDKFKAAKEAGFDGIELDAPGINLDEAKRAIQEVEFPVDGTVNSTHWKITHTHADPSVRSQALKSLIDGIKETSELGGDTILLVPGVGGDGTFEECYQRAVNNIRQAVEVAEKYNVKIAIENVWNKFLYDHDGDSNQTADLFVQFVDEFDSPWVGMQFDIGNHWKYGDMAAWIRQLDQRIVKLDAKGFSRAKDKFTDIGEGDIDWPAVRQALLDIHFTGWVAAEVGGGDVERLRTISDQLDRHLVNEPAAS